MSEEPEEPTEPPTETPEPEENNDIVIRFDGMEKLEEAEAKSVSDTIQQLSEVIKQQKQRIDGLEAANTETKKEALLQKLAAADYNPDDFKEMDINSLEIMLQGLAKSNDTIKIPQKKDKDKAQIKRPPVQIYVPGKGYVNFWDNLDNQAGKNKS